jgi:hypothetical protein
VLMAWQYVLSWCSPSLSLSVAANTMCIKGIRALRKALSMAMAILPFLSAHHHSL